MPTGLAICLSSDILFGPVTAGKIYKIYATMPTGRSGDFAYQAFNNRGKLYWYNSWVMYKLQRRESQ